MVIRLAYALGLHRDGTALGLSPFETDMRRRLWYQICALDFLSSDTSGTVPSISQFDSKLPLNINDADLRPEMTELPEPRIGVTEMTFVLIQNEIINTQRRLRQNSSTGDFSMIGPKLTIAEKEGILQELSDHLESTYLQYCDNAGPILGSAATLARLMVSNLSLVNYGLVGGDPSNSIDLLPQATKDRLFRTCIGSIEQTRSLAVDSDTKKFAWIFKAEVQWYAMAYILREVGLREPSELVEKGWEVVDRVFAGWGDEGPPQKSNATLWRPMRKLMVNARRKREAARLTSLKGAETPLMTGTQNIEPVIKADPHMFTVTDDTFSGMQHSSISRGFTPVPADAGVWQSAPEPPLYDNNSGNVIPGYQMPQQQMFDPMMSQPQNMSWMYDAYGPVDSSMDNMEIPFESWDDVVRDFHMDVDPRANAGAGPGTARMDGGGLW